MLHSGRYLQFRAESKRPADIRVLRPRAARWKLELSTAVLETILGGGVMIT
jgi:hypothetical protein